MSISFFIPDESSLLFRVGSRFYTLVLFCFGIPNHSDEGWTCGHRLTAYLGRVSLWLRTLLFSAVPCISCPLLYYLVPSGMGTSSANLSLSFDAFQDARPPLATTMASATLKRSPWRPLRLSGRSMETSCHAGGYFTLHLYLSTQVSQSC